MSPFKFATLAAVFWGIAGFAVGRVAGALFQGGRLLSCTSRRWPGSRRLAALQCCTAPPVLGNGEPWTVRYCGGGG